MKKILFISSDITEDIKKRLSSGFDLRLLPPCEDLPRAVACHADMLIGVIDGKLIVTRSYYEKNEGIFAGCPLLITDERHGGVYPQDVLLNFIDTENTVIGYEKTLTKLVQKPVITVKQGYSRCSTLVGCGFAVSADAGVLSALKSVGYDTLCISSGHIRLPGYDCGFIGGASFADGDTVCFFGELSSHPDAEMLRSFLQKHNVKTKELSVGPLTDYGGAVISGCI